MTVVRTARTGSGVGSLREQAASNKTTPITENNRMDFIAGFRMDFE